MCFEGGRLDERLICCQSYTQVKLPVQQNGFFWLVKMTGHLLIRCHWWYWGKSETSGNVVSAGKGATAFRSAIRGSNGILVILGPM